MRIAIEELSRVEIITNMTKVDALSRELPKFGITGMTIYNTLGCGVQLGAQEYETPMVKDMKLLMNQVIMVVLPSAEVDSFLDFVEKNLYTGHIGDGKIFVSPITNAIRIRTGEEGKDALTEGDLD